jgi:predicted TIM-barrel fold metal-dependent hydrolase
MKNLSDPYWDPLLAAIQDLDLSINLHIGFNLQTAERAETGSARMTKNSLARRTNRLSFIKNLALSNSSVIEAAADLILQGTFERFPGLKVVSVESGFGYFPFALDSMDWHWHTSAANHQFPSRELPSVIWRQHFFATFWFEWSSLRLLDDFQDNVMFETDFPHETGVYPGGWEHNSTARDLVRRHLGVVSDEVARKVLSGNAAKLYRIPLPDAG